MGPKEERIAPIKLNEKTSFPEIKFVNNFIDTFFAQRDKNILANKRAEQDAEGRNVWIPISPIDSTLATSDLNSPYIAIDPTTNAVNILTDNRLTQILKIILNRFYVLSQSSIPNNIYGKSKSYVNNAYVQLYAKSEAANLANSITNSNYGNLIKNFAYDDKENITKFYTDLNTYVPNLYNFPTGTTISISIANDLEALVDKNNSEYQGVAIYPQGMSLQIISDASQTPIEQFKSDIKKNGFLGGIFNTTKELYYQFSKENVLYLIDQLLDTSGTAESNNVFDADKNNLITRFLISNTETPYSFSNVLLKPTIPNLLTNGNKALGSTNEINKHPKRNLKKFQNIVNIWTSQLPYIYHVNNNPKYFDDLIYPDIIQHPSKLSALFLLSNFGCTLGSF